MTRMSQVSLSSVAAKNQPARRGGGPSSSSSSLLRYFIMAAALLLLGILVMVFVQSPTTSSSTTPQQHGDTTNPATTSSILSASSRAATTLVPNEIVKGEWNGEAYYHCPANNESTSNKKVQDIVLWHGAAFTKEEWKTSGILQKLCSVDHFSVTALDLSHRSNHQALVELLHALQNDPNKQLLTLPLAAIVTPSASGFGVVDWINQDTVDFVQSVQLWVPVACPATTQLHAENMEDLKNRHFPVLSIHGDQDAPGKERSNLLRDKMGAEVVQLQGGHPCYLDSPDAFVETLTKRLENERLKNSQQ